MKHWQATDRFVRRSIAGVGCAAIAVTLAFGEADPEMTWGAAITHLVTSSEVDHAKAHVRDGIAKRAMAKPTATDPRLRQCVNEWNAVRRDPDQSLKWHVLSRCGLVFEAATCTAGPSEPWSVLAIGQALGERAARMAAHDPAGALDRLLEEIRFGQRHQRGQGLTMSSTGTRVIVDALDHIDAIVLRDRPSNVDVLVKTVDALIANEPSFAESVAADGLVIAHDLGLQRLDHPFDPTDLDARGGAIMSLLVGLENPARVARACPAAASFATCARRLARPPHVFHTNGTTRAIVLQAMFESNTAGYALAMRAQLAERTVTHGRLIALRMRLEILRAGCDSSALARLATTPKLGGMQLRRTGNTLVVTPPAWLARGAPIKLSCAR